MRTRKIALGLAAVAAFAICYGCGTDGATAAAGDDGSRSGTDGTTPTEGPGSSNGPTDNNPGTGPGPSSNGSKLVGRCGDPVPAGAVEAADLPVYAGTCPALAAMPSYTTITSSGFARKFIVVKPTNPPAGKKLPVIFAWHWLNASATSFFRPEIDVQDAANKRNVIFIVPESKGDDQWDWPYAVYVNDARLEEEAKLADDMLACVAAAMPVDKNCVGSMGVSAGALFTAQLVQVRANRLASFVSVSGGVGDLLRGWDASKVTRKLPALVVWGGPSDNLVAIDFNAQSKKLEDALVAGGHFLFECIHNCGHTAPPLDAPAPGSPPFDMLWTFMLDHPYWTSVGASPYQTSPVPPSYPGWCAPGQGKAITRTGACEGGKL